MTRTPLILLAALAAPCLAAPALAQQPQPQRLTVVIDPARGGSEYGARIDGHTYEKQVTLDLANRLRSLLQARDFNVVLTRETDTVVTNEQRAAVANTSRPIACLLLHAAPAGTGIHLWTSSLAPVPAGTTAVLWDEAQSPFVDRSNRLASEFAAAFSRSKIAVSSGHTWIRPLDNMQCPALALEVGPEDSDTPASDRAYQAHIADAVASQLLFWRGHTDIVNSIVAPPTPARPAETESQLHSSTTTSGTAGAAAPGAALPHTTTPAGGTRPPNTAATPGTAASPRPRPATTQPATTPSAEPQSPTPRAATPRPATPRPTPPTTQADPQ